MGRKKLREDVFQTSQQPPPYISDVRNGDDGEIVFRYHYHEGPVQISHELRLLARDVDEYPAGNSYIIFTNDDTVSPLLMNCFESLSVVLNGQSVFAALEELANGLNAALVHDVRSEEAKSNDTNIRDPNSRVSEYNRTAEVDKDDDSDINDSNHGDNDDDFSDDDLEDDEDAFDFGDGHSQPFDVALPRNKPTSVRTRPNMLKLKHDLQQAKAAGFKVGVLGDPCSSAIAVVSIRISKLGISEEVMKAWQLQPKQYLVLLIRFLRQYESAEDVRGRTSLQGSTEMRTGLCTSYKPDYENALEYFAHLKSNQRGCSQVSPPAHGTHKIQPLFIDQSLNALLRERFALILKWREDGYLSWSGAEKLVQDTQGSIGELGFTQLEEYRSLIDDDSDRLLPSIVTADSLSGTMVKNCSLPLVAMQFTLRHFVRCTEFCLNCHCRVPESFAALKPYVCSKDLCLYQYMTLGFGPSIEWEITTQPYVVDLLISFCYIQAFSHRLRTFPTGIHLLVPMLSNYEVNIESKNPYSARFFTSTTNQTNEPSTTVKIEKDCSLSYRSDIEELLFTAEQTEVGRKFRAGQYVVLYSNNNTPTWTHHRIEEVLFPVVKLSKAISSTGVSGHMKSTTTNYTVVDCFLYRHDFDSLSDVYKQEAMMVLLNTIPSVADLRQWLITHGHGENREVSLRQWRDGLVAPALDLLRWVIASNRSCILQVDGNVSANNSPNDDSLEQRVSGMEEYMQFRFAQGAPDKEQKFIKAINDHSTGPYRTLFAWHGSPIQNWHSIIREGLHFNETMHGRAYGHGVYMSPTVQTSLGYSRNFLPTSPSGNEQSQWRNSQLKPTHVLSLNEVVNNTGAFVSSNPHYVVAETDWIQTRYLFVQTSVQRGKTRDALESVVQDPQRMAIGTDNKPIVIPVSAIATSRRTSNKQSHQETKKRKLFKWTESRDGVVHIDDDSDSVCTLAGDREFLMSTEESDADDVSDILMLYGTPDVGSPKKKPRLGDTPPEYELIRGCLLDASKTNFRPGGPDINDVRKLPPPEDASRAATGALMKAYGTLTKLQQTTPVHSLGWFIDTELENMYQWIVELHSFDKDLPLAMDMESAGMTSVILEMRFTNEFPFQPPFVRVIKPRFLPFREGGGGHVTEGGAICMELLTNSGWSSVSSMENILLQIRMALCDTERPARLSAVRGGGRWGTFGNSNSTYSVGEAIVAYERACRAHGWAIPPALSRLFKGEQTTR